MKYVTTHHDHYDISDSIDFCSKEINRLKSPSTIGNVNINLNVCAVCNQSVNTCVCNNNVNQKVHVSSTCGECAICLDDLEEGDPIARLPCLCIYHKE